MLVSVIIPTCNSRFTLALAVKSALSEVGNFGEVIVLNDGVRPLDTSWLKLDGRLIIREDFPRSIEELGFPSGGYTRNKGIEIARGRYIAFLDDDDQFEPGKLAKQLSLMERNNWTASCTDAYISILPLRNIAVRERFNSYYSAELKTVLESLGLTALPTSFDKTHLKRHNFIITSSVVCTKEILLNVGGFNNIKVHGQIINGVKDFEDWNLWRRISSHTNFHFINEPLVHYKRGSIKKIFKKLISFYQSVLNVK